MNDCDEESKKLWHSLRVAERKDYDDDAGVPKWARGKNIEKIQHAVQDASGFEHPILPEQDCCRAWKQIATVKTILGISLKDGEHFFEINYCSVCGRKL